MGVADRRVRRRPLPSRRTRSFPVDRPRHLGRVRYPRGGQPGRGPPDDDRRQLRDNLRGREERQERRALRPRRGARRPGVPAARRRHAIRTRAARPRQGRSRRPPRVAGLADIRVHGRHRAGPGPGRRGQHLPARLADAGVPHHVRPGWPGRDAVTGPDPGRPGPRGVAHRTARRPPGPVSRRFLGRGARTTGQRADRAEQ